MEKSKTWKLYRNMSEVIHPSISRKNISEYKIILGEKMIPLEVFYPKKNVTLDKIIIYIHGEDINYSYYEKLALETNQLILLLDYSKNYQINDIRNYVEYIITELLDCKLKEDNITIMGDFSGGDVILQIDYLFENTIYKNIKKILLSPKDEQLDKYHTSNILVLSNNENQLGNKGIKFQLLNESIYDFTHDINLVPNEKIYYYIKQYIANELEV